MENVKKRSYDMIGLVLAIIIFNSIAFIFTKKRQTTNQIIHIIVFTIALQSLFDLFIEFKYQGYWYFSKKVDFSGLIAHLFVVPPVNIMFLKWYPFRLSIKKRILYIVIWEVITLTYELITLLPEPWGYFHYGWWNLGHTIIVNPILFIILIKYYKWIVRKEKEAVKQYERGLL
ncbi:hypothetical protein [Heyndrickxia sporothermodurans]|uniref:hypothetical protein n=3 Tax=Heyndrickxia sporothermodurans TaxID=46224 RepID=UPI001F422EFA|nr:hypothetical protein [Heyndrickxia sporothermodurans]